MVWGLWVRKVISRVNAIRSLEIPKLLFALEAPKCVRGYKKWTERIYRRNRNLSTCT